MTTTSCALSDTAWRTSWAAATRWFLPCAKRVPTFLPGVSASPMSQTGLRPIHASAYAEKKRRAALRLVVERARRRRSDVADGGADESFADALVLAVAVAVAVVPPEVSPAIVRCGGGALESDMVVGCMLLRPQT